jgi:selenide, water dikinase
LGVAFAGGHSIDGQDPLFGLSVTGLVKKSNLKTNAGAKIGDIICMTKPLGIGMLAAATKRKIASDEQRNELHELLTQINDIGEDLGAISGISAMTDITGFGLLGHLLELCKASEVGATVEFGKLPLANAARSLAASYVLPDNAMRNWNAYEKECELQNMEAFTWVVDPQTNGGLLFTVSPDALQEVRNVFELREKALYEVGLITSNGVIMV